MARVEDRLEGNAEGELYVDASCIDCAVCRNVAPATFRASRRSGTSLVHAQPRSAEEWHRARMALVACPTSSIGTVHKDDVAATRAAADAFPEPLGDGVYFCGYAAESSYGAQSYLIVRRGGKGNVLVDSPRAVPRLMERIEALGGVRTMFLTHRDDVADHAKFAERFGCERVMHADDVTSSTRDVERRIEGNAPVALFAGEDDLLVVPVPGHTRGSAALLYRPAEALFTGDHLFATEDGERLYAARSVCWYSWPEQKRSLARLLELDFAWVLPGHEGRMKCASTTEMRARLRHALQETHERQ